jgi:hypothetical protein
MNSLFLIGITFTCGDCSVGIAIKPDKKEMSKREMALTPKEETEIRNLIYTGEPITVFAKEGRYKGFAILLVPKRIKQIYDQKKPETVRLLLSIVEGGRPVDGLYAAGVLFALIDSPINGEHIATYVLVQRDLEETPG